MQNKDKILSIKSFNLKIQHCVCRFCFNIEPIKNLINPCQCNGSVKWIHLNCLRKWQRSHYISQPTHPLFYNEDKHKYVCNICKTKFIIEPLKRKHVMKKFLGDMIDSIRIGKILITTELHCKQLKE